MRTLKFIVDELILKPDPSCDFSGLVPGSEGYLQAVFSFSPEWNKYAKVASFWSLLGVEYPPQVLEDGMSCMIPAEALARRIFKIQIIGKNPHNGVKISTNYVEINQNGGGV